MTLSAVKNLILTSLDLDTIRQKRDQAPKQQSKKQIQKAMQETIKGDKNIYKEDYRDTPSLRRFRFQNQQ
jgi:hypothetical protein